MFKKNHIIILSSFLFSLSVIAQNDVYDYTTLNEKLQILKGQDEDNKIQGSPYFENEFVKAEILEDGNKDIDAFIRYNVIKDEIEIKVNKQEDEIFILPRYDDFSYELKDYSYFQGKFATTDNRVLVGYMVKYYKDDNLLFIAKPSGKITARRAAETSYDRAQPAKYVLQTDYYLGVGNKPLTEVRLREKDFKKILDNDKNMHQYFKEHKVNEIEDVVKMLEYYSKTHKI